MKVIQKQLTRCCQKSNIQFIDSESNFYTTYSINQIGMQLKINHWTELISFVYIAFPQE